MNKVRMEQVERFEVARLISSAMPDMVEFDWATLQECLLLTQSLWVGFVNEKLVCVWGLIPPTLMSSQAYLWLWTTESVKDHEFLFVRNSQKALEKMLEEYPSIVGQVSVDNPRAKKWLKWLGAVFKESDGVTIPFVIRKKSHG